MTSTSRFGTGTKDDPIWIKGYTAAAIARLIAPMDEKLKTLPTAKHDAYIAACRAFVKGRHPWAFPGAYVKIEPYTDGWSCSESEEDCQTIADRLAAEVMAP